jgi:hypothetical protein
MAQRPAEAVELPDDQGVARAQLVQDLLKADSSGSATLISDTGSGRR